MTQYLTKRNIIIAAIAVVLLSVIVVTVVLQLGSKIPTITFDCGTLEEKETGIFYQGIPIDWKGGTKEEKEIAEIAKEEGYFAAMQGQIGCTLYTGRTINFSFEEIPERVTLKIYDEYGELVESTLLDETYSFSMPQEVASGLYVLEGVWEKGTCAYAFWVETM